MGDQFDRHIQRRIANANRKHPFILMANIIMILLSVQHASFEFIHSLEIGPILIRMVSSAYYNSIKYGALAIQCDNLPFTRLLVVIGLSQLKSA